VSIPAPWVRIASSVLSAKDLFLFNGPFAESTLEAMRTQGDWPRQKNSLDAKLQV